MGQYFVLLNIDQRQCLERVGKLGENIWTFPKRLADVLQVSGVSLPPEPDITALRSALKKAGITSGTTGNRSCSSASIFNKFPVDIVDAILDQLSDHYVDCICLGLCNLHLWKIARRHIEACLRKVGCCAGDRLICIGDYAKDGDLPLGMLAAGELKELRGTDPSTSEEEEEEGANTLYKGCYWPRLASVETWTILGDLRMRGLDAADVQLWELLAGRDFLMGPASGAPLVLRNITTHEYVRGVELDGWKHRNSRRLSYVNNINLGYACAIRICWSSDDSVAMAYEGDIHRGVWAGHRFDIVPEGDWICKGQNKEWKDVSEEVLRELYDIWASEMIIPEEEQKKSESDSD